MILIAFRGISCQDYSEWPPMLRLHGRLILRFGRRRKRKRQSPVIDLNLSPYKMEQKILLYYLVVFKELRQMRALEGSGNCQWYFH